MSSNIDEFQKLGKEQLEAVSSVAASLAKGLQTIAAETIEFSKKSIETNSAYVEKMTRAKSIDEAIQIQSEFVKSAYEGFAAQATKNRRALFPPHQGSLQTGREHFRQGSGCRQRKDPRH